MALQISECIELEDGTEEFGALKKINLPSGSLLDRVCCQKGGERVDLSLCDLTKIPVDSILILGKGTPECLDLSFNSIRLVSTKFVQEMVHLTKLDLSRNEIKKLPENFGDLKKLVYLDLHQNMLEKLPLSIRQLDNLEHLILSDNPFRAPLCDYITTLSTDSSGMAEMMVLFMKEFYAAIEEKSKNARSLEEIRRVQHLKILKYFPHEITINDNECSEVESAAEILVYAKEPKPKSFRVLESIVTICKTLLILAILLAFTSVIVAYLVDTSYLDQMIRDRPYLEYIWTNFYKQIREMALPVANIMPGNPPLFLRGPPPDTSNFFQKIIRYFQQLFELLPNWHLSNLS